MITPYMMCGGFIAFAVLLIVMGGMLGAIIDRTGC